MAIAWMPAISLEDTSMIRQRNTPRLQSDPMLRTGVIPRNINKFAMLFSVRGGDTNDKPYLSKGSQKQSTFGLSLSLFVTYLTVMGAKCALPSTLSSITSAHSDLAHFSTTLSRQDVVSRLLAFSTLSIALGKFALGPVIDSIGGIESLQIALTTLFLCLGCIGFGPKTCPTLISLAGYWIVVDFAFSSCWAASVKSIRDYMEESRWSREIGKLAMAARIGNAISFAFFAWLLQLVAVRDNAVTGSGIGIVGTSWRWVYRASSLIQLVPLALLYFSKKHTILNNTGNDTTSSASKSQKQSIVKRPLAILAREARTPEFWLHLFTRTIMMVLISFLLFIPTYMHQCYGLSTASSARVGSSFAVGCLTSVMTLSQRTYPSSSTAISYKQKSWAMFGFLSISTICLTLQYAFLKGMIQLTPVMGSFLMFMWGFSLSIPFYIPGSMFALKRGGEKGSATIADAFDVCGFGLLAIFNAYVAKILNVVGDVKAAWAPVFLWMLSGSAISMVSMFFAVSMEGERNKRQDGAIKVA